MWLFFTLLLVFVIIDGVYISNGKCGLAVTDVHIDVVNCVWFLILFRKANEANNSKFYPKKTQYIYGVGLGSNPANPLAPMTEMRLGFAEML